jgi:Mn-dependent DtxR family transcriptional regulator
MPAPTATDRLRKLLADAPGGVVEASVPRLARRLGVTPSCARAAVRRLEQAGEVERERCMSLGGSVLPTRYRVLRSDRGRG